MTQLRTVAIAGRVSPPLFQSLVLTAPHGVDAQKGATFAVSLVLHSSLAAALAILPLVLGDALPSAGTSRIFDPPLEIRLLPPPPAAPPEGTPVVRARRAVPAASGGFVAPRDVPTDVAPETPTLFDLGGDPDGIRGGVPGLERSEVGSVVHIPEPMPVATPPVVRISRLQAPQLVEQVPPVYPPLALSSGVSGTVTLEAEVDTSGRVRTVRVVKSHPLFDSAATEAVRQWRYRPLLLSGEPTPFLLEVQVDFLLRR